MKLPIEQKPHLSTKMKSSFFLFHLFLFGLRIDISAGWVAKSGARSSARQRHHERTTTILPASSRVLQGTPLTRNITHGESWLPALGQTMKSMDELTKVKKGPSLTRAIQHTNAILDLYNETGRGLSVDLVMSTLENVVQHSTAKPQEVTGELLEEVESLVWRLRNFDLIPSLRVLQALWEMQQYHTVNLAEKASKQVGRQVNLLAHWREWSQKGQLSPPPISYLVGVLQYAASEHVSMSFTLWELYQAVSRDTEVPCERVLYSHVLKVLSQSPSSWNVRQRRVCQDMITQSRRKLIQPFWPTPEEINDALEATVPVGRAQDAAWLTRILEMSPECCEDMKKECRRLFLKALLYSDDPGSLLYMEELLFSGKRENESIEDWKILLNKCVRWNQVGCGERAAIVLHKIEQKCEENGELWTPDAEILGSVVQAYLNEPDRSLQHLLQATRVVKRCITKYKTYSSSHKSQFRLFDKLLGAFDEYARTDPIALKEADDLFRFFVVQHRDGRVESEEPGPFHLGHILRYYNRQYRKETLRRGAGKSLEYFRLFRSLYQKGLISTPPDLFNVRQLLGTLARTPDPGFGAVANETLAEALAVESAIHPYALGHMFWCVIKCFCNENNVDAALQVLDQWEQAHHANPAMIRLTGAPYQTLIHTMALHPAGNNPGKARALMDRVERQYHIGNERVKLRKKLLQEALQCCGDDLEAQEHIRRSFYRMNFTTLGKSCIEL